MCGHRCPLPSLRLPSSAPRPRAGGMFVHDIECWIRVRNPVQSSRLLCRRLRRPTCAVASQGVVAWSACLADLQGWWTGTSQAVSVGAQNAFTQAQRGDMVKEADIASKAAQETLEHQEGEFTSASRAASSKSSSSTLIRGSSCPIRSSVSLQPCSKVATQCTPDSARKLAGPDVLQGTKSALDMVATRPRRGHFDSQTGPVVEVISAAQMASTSMQTITRV